MSAVSGDVLTFLEAVALTPGLWASVSVRTIAVRVSDRWHNLVTRCQLEPHSPDDIRPLDNPPQLEMLRLEQMVLPAADLQAFVAAVTEGEATVGSLPISFLATRSPSETEQEPYSRSFCNLCSDIEAPQTATGFRIGHRLRLFGGSGNEFFKDLPRSRDGLNAALIALEHPWDGLDGLTLHGVGSTARIDYHTDVSAEFVAPLPLRWLGAALEKGLLRYRVQVGPAAASSKCSIGVFGIQAEGPPVSESIAMQPGALIPDGPAYAWDGTSTFEGARLLTLLLRLGPFLVERRIVADPIGGAENPRIAVYRVFDRDLTELNRLLTAPQPKDKDLFHSAVSRLFTIAGFSVDSFVADKPLQGRHRGPVDFIAYAPTERFVLVVECTTGTLASKEGKAGRLVTRARDVQAALANVSGDEVLAMMVTALEAVPESELQDAATDGVAVVTLPDLGALLRLAEEQAPLAKIVGWCRARVPHAQAPGMMIGRKPMAS